MGGKRKQAQRIKNNTKNAKDAKNAKPSSSGRNTEVFNPTLTKFVGFSGVKDGALILPAFSLTTDELDNSIDINFQLVLKKMSKKDATTKLKALQEFTELCKSAEPEVIKTILPFWPRLYCNLATDSEHRVREGAHVAHLEVVKKAKKNLAPYLKHLAGAWFTSQYDTYPPAASAATKAFETAFPSNKLTDAIIFCQNEILSYIYDNIVVQTAQTLSHSKTASPEEADAKYHQVMVSSLQGYALYLKRVPSEQIEKASEHNLRIITHPKFWKIAKNKSSSIRAAWFSVISTLCQKASFLLESEDSHVVGAVFGSLGESDPVVLPNVWEAVLCTIITIKEWWKYTNVERVVLNKLWKVLRDGGQGNASVIFPNLLPLLSHLPPVEDMNAFYTSFFENLRNGLKHRTVITSRSEAVAVSTAFIECLQFVILRNQNDVALCEQLIKQQLLPSIEWSLMEIQAPYKTLFNQIATVVQYWGRNVDNQDVPHYKRYLQYFWDSLDSLFQGLLMNLELNFEKNAVSDFASRQIELLLSLKHIAKSKKQMKVSFSKEDQGEQSDQKSRKEVGFSESYLKALENLVMKVCKSYVRFINKKESKELIQYLYVLLQDFENQKFLDVLSSEASHNDSNSFFDIYENLLAHWLKNEALCSTYVIDLIFLLLKHSNDEEKKKILDSLLKLQNEEAFGWCIKKSLSFPHKECPILQEWLNEEQVEKFFVGISKKIVEGNCPPDLDLILKQAFEEKEDRELFITKATIGDIIEIFSKALLEPVEHSSSFDTCVRFSAHIAGSIYNESYKLSHGDGLLLAMFKLSCRADTVQDALSNDTTWEIKNVWQDVISMLCRELSADEFKTLVGKCADVIEEQVLHQKVNENSNVDFIVDIVVTFVKSVHAGNPIRINDVVHIFLRRDFLVGCEKGITYLCQRGEYVKGRLSCPYKELEKAEIDGETNVSDYFAWNLLTVNVLASTLPNGDDGSDDEDGARNEEQKEMDTEIIDYLSEVEKFIVGNIYAVALSHSFIDIYRNTKYYTKTMQQHILIKEKLVQLITGGKNEFVRQVEDTICKRAMGDGWIWAVAAHVFYSEILPKGLGATYVKTIRNHRDEIRSEISVLHMGQVFAKSLSYDHVHFDLTPIESIICLRSLLHCDEIDVQIAEVFAKVDKIKAERQKKFLLESSSDSLSWEDFQLTTEVMRLLADIIEHKKDFITAARWDFSIVAFTTWLENIAKMKSKFKSTEVAAIISAVSNLYVSIRKHLLWLEEHMPLSAKNTLDEWNSLFSCDVHRFITELFLYFVDYYQNMTSVPIEDLPLLQEFGKVIQHLDYNYLFSKKDVNAPKWTKLVEKCCSLVTHPLNTLQLFGYHMLLILVPGLVEIDTESVNSNTPLASGLTIEHFKSALVHTEEIAHSMLLGFKLGEDSCTVQPFTDSYTYTFAYLLLWDIILNLCSKSSTELRFQYADWIKNNDFLTKLLNNIFRLMPSEVLHQSNSKTKPFASLFFEKFPADFTESFLSLNIEHMVCWIYAQSLSQLPAIVRQWWSVTETRVAQIVDRVTSVYVSPTLCSEELADVVQHEKKFKNMTVKVHPNVREVVAVYSIDEAQMELLITLPNNYPLKVPDIQCNKQICGTSHRQWILQLKTNILHQNGRIWDGLSLWNNNLDKKFDGVEECYICFAVLHQGTYQLPRLTCSTCRKKFHSACLYKWFSTSNKSTCPICRNLF